MKLKLICSNSYQLLLKEFLEARNFQISEQAELALVENGQKIPEDVISLVFNPQQIDQLISFLENQLGNGAEQKEKNLQDHLIGQLDENYEIINYQDIILFEAQNSIIYARTKAKKYRLKEKLYQLEEELAAEGFIRINKSEIVNIIHIKEIVPWFNGRLLLKLDIKKEIEVSRSYAGDFKKYLGL
ncbi:LytTR family DNA-binding domain-containing protein [Halanaerobium sp. ST460_2HS_T2]|uniref:LytTR family DNA-binding domain-containing protein n=1 Tax=Halanaerobium sp. ST460_2HS_T2 TaxID=2183914 RepID=UPI000DF2C4A5|nr:LytTR family DNA-binding domain-containing protein [Halanaerobium sp. ST460_2HS_T2]RCW50638.1 LytTR family transcriptional regulator [Halanaerobium sp. ST460_2HS_T2]